MQQSSPKNSLYSIGTGLILVLGLATLTPSAFARQPVSSPAPRYDISSPIRIAMADPPDFLAPAPAREEELKGEERGGAITPFVGTSQALSLLSLPERPAIAASDVASLERPEVTAGVDVDLGTVKFNLGYTLPSDQVDEFVRPLGVELEPGEEGKRFSLGVEIPF